jgi:regulatory protein
MKITAIKQQVKRIDRYSLFIDEKYAFSLSENALLESGLSSGVELSKEEVEKYKQLSQDDKLYGRALRYIALRPRSAWEMETYLDRKGASPALIEQILNKLTKFDLLNDVKLAQSFVNDRRLLRPTSRRKLIAELRKKRIPDEIVQSAIGTETTDEQAALQHIIETKRRQTKYQDDLRLMQYLARQGFTYDDIKTALQKNKDA